MESDTSADEPRITEKSPSHHHPRTSSEPPSPKDQRRMTEPPSPRLQRLDVRTQKKASVEDASTLDFTSLSACDKGMFRECQNGAADRPRIDEAETPDRPALAMRLSAIGLPLQRVLRTASNSSEHLDSKASSDVDLADLANMPKSVVKDPARPKSSRGGSSIQRSGSMRGSSAGDSPPKSSHSISWSSLPGSGWGSGLSRPMGQPRASHSTTVGTDSLAGSSLAGLGVHRLRPSPRPEGSAYGTHASSLGLGRHLHAGSRNPSQGSLSSFGGSIRADSALGHRLETPPGAPNAHEAHLLLVACPAPRRHERKCVARSRLQHSF